MITAKCTDGTTVVFDSSKPIGQGGEKVCFFSQSKKEVVCFFLNGLVDRHERSRRLEKIIRRYNPTNDPRPHGDYWKEHFCWPTRIIDRDGSIPNTFIANYGIANPPLAVVSPAYRSTFFFKTKYGKTVEGNSTWFTSEKCLSLVPDDVQGSFLSRLKICARLARAVRRMHFAGLAHSDLSNKNVLVSPKHEDACLIDIDSLVVPGIAPPSVIGTPGYVAPEVLAGKKNAAGKPIEPSVETDRHAMAVLMYEYLLNRHPLKGRKVNSKKSGEEDEHLRLGSQALFIEHAKDPSNRLPTAPKVPLNALGPYLEALFRKAFEEGLHHPAKRPDAPQWERAISRTFDLLHPSPEAGKWFVLAPGMPTKCPFTGKKLKNMVPFASCHLERKPGEYIPENHSITIYHNMFLHALHMKSNVFSDATVDRKPKGYFSFHNGEWVLVNQSGAAMQVIGGSDVPHGQMVKIKKGLKLLLHKGEMGRLLIFDFMKAVK